MKKIFLFMLILLIGCENKQEPISEVCLNGVVYYEFWTSNALPVLSPKFNRDSKVESCNQQGDYYVD